MTSPTTLNYRKKVCQLKQGVLTQSSKKRDLKCGELHSFNECVAYRPKSPNIIRDSKRFREKIAQGLKELRGVKRNAL